MEATLEIDPLQEFFDAIKSPLTKSRYEKRLDQFFKHVGIEGSSLRERARAFVKRATEDHKWATAVINEYMRYHKMRAERGEIEESTVPNFYKPIKLFCEENDIILNWNKISRRIPKGRHYADDRAPTLEEIRAILQYPERRIKPAVTTMESSGIRLGAWDYLRWSHIQPMERDGQIVAAKVTVYHATKDEYRTFMTPEAYNAVKEWIDFRAQHGEHITKDSWVMRDLWDTTGSRGLATAPKKLKSSGLKRMIERALVAQGIRKPLPPGKKRHEFQADHGFRKFFETACERNMKTLHVEMLLGHDTGLKESYHRPKEEEMLSDYLKAVPDLTISESERLKGESKIDDRFSILEKSLEEANRQNTDLRLRFVEIYEDLQTMKRIIAELDLERKRELARD